MVFLIASVGAQPDYEFNFEGFVAFDEIAPIAGTEVTETIRTWGYKVRSILAAIEGEARRLGFIQ
jgi:hypothetical protein